MKDPQTAPLHILVEITKASPPVASASGGRAVTSIEGKVKNIYKNISSPSTPLAAGDSVSSNATCYPEGYAERKLYDDDSPDCELYVEGATIEIWGNMNPDTKALSIWRVQSKK